MQPPALDLRDVSVGYRRARAGPASEPALDGVTLAVHPGECVGIAAGPRAGLTTLLLCGAGLVGPDAGCVRWFGSHHWSRARAAYAPPAPEGHPYLSVRAWLEFAAAQADDGPAAPEPDVDGALALASLTEFSRIRVGHLTPGVAARLALAGALLGAPRVLLLDRPFDSLAAAERVRLAHVLAPIRSAGMALVVGTRDAAAIAPLTPGRIHYLAGGRLGAPAGDAAALELEVPLPVEARSRLALRLPTVVRRGRALRIPLERLTPEQVLGECRALGIEVRASRVVSRDPPSRRRVAEPRAPHGSAPVPPAASFRACPSSASTTR